VTANPALETPSSLTMHVAEFVTSSHGSSLPDGVIELGRKSILDGLGLAIAKRLVEAHAGTIWIDRGVSEGTRIVFTLPGRVGVS